MRNGDVSFWYTGLPEPGPPLPGDTSVDVAIVGAGFTGLWTAYYLKRARPDLDVAVVEREFAGFGASGRNGGWLSAEFAGSRERYARAAGREAVLRLTHAMRDTVDEVAQRIRVAGAVGGSFSPHCARVQPARLVRGLAAAVRRLGVHIHEQTAVTAVAPRTVRTDHGTVTARHVLRCLEGFTAGLPGHRREWLPMQTADGRIALGGRGRPYRFGSRTDHCGRTAQSTVDSLTALLRMLFPAAAGVPVAHAWSGVLGVPRDWCTTVTHDPVTGTGWAGRSGGGSRNRCAGSACTRCTRCTARADRRESRSGSTSTSRLARVADAVAGRGASARQQRSRRRPGSGPGLDDRTETATEDM